LTFPCSIRCTFELTSDGEVYWRLPPPDDENGEGLSDDSLSLFSCTAFEVLRARVGITTATSVRFAAVRGHVMDFDLSEDAGDGRCEALTLTYSGLLVVQCVRDDDNCKDREKGVRAIAEEAAEGKPYDLLQALEDGFFANMEVQDPSGRMVSRNAPFDNG